MGTDLLFAAATKLGGTPSFARQRIVPWRVVAWLSLGSVPASLLTLTVWHWIGPAKPQVQSFMTHSLGVALLLTAAAMLYKTWHGQEVPSPVSPADLASAAQPRHRSVPALFGALIGVLLTLNPVGAGAIGGTVLLRLYPLLPLPRVVAADIAYAVPLMLVAGLGHASMGSVDWHLLTLLLAGSLPGIWLGIRLVHHTPARLVRAMLSLLLAWAGTRLVLI